MFYRLKYIGNIINKMSKYFLPSVLIKSPERFRVEVGWDDPLSSYFITIYAICDEDPDIIDQEEKIVYASGLIPVGGGKFIIRDPQEFVKEMENWVINPIDIMEDITLIEIIKRE